MISGLVSTSRSLQPLRSRGQSLKRSPRNAASSSLCCWIMVPMAPSRMTMRSANNWRSAWARCDCFANRLTHWPTLRSSVRPHAERVADRVGELGTVQRIEMKLVDAVTLQRVHLLDGHRGGNQLARLGIFFEAVEAMLQPIRDRRAATLGEARDLREARDGQDARHDAARRCLSRAQASRKRRNSSVS